MQKTILNELIATQDLPNLEKHLIYSYILQKGLDYSNSLLLQKYFKEFNFNENIFIIIKQLEIQSLKSLENYLELLIPDNDRKLNGAFFTPQFIIDFIINEMQPDINEKNLDPSCGCGAFLMGLAEYYKTKFNKSIKATVKENIFGADILDYNVHRSKIILTLFALESGEILEEKDFNIKCQDSLKAKWNIRFDNLVGNPPYVKFQDLTEEYRIYLLQNWTTIQKGTFNLYFAFFELGFNLLKRNGKLGFITPNNYFTSISGESLREFLQKNKSIYKIIDFSSTKIFDAQTYTAITFLTKRKNSNVFFDRINSNTPQIYLKNIQYSEVNINNLNNKKWRLLKNDEQENIRIIESIGIPIGKLFDINVGVATLKDDVYFVDSINLNRGNIIKTTEKGIFKIEMEVTKPVYKISDFKNQEEVFNNTRRIIFPYKYDTNNRLIPIPENEFKQKFPNCYKYLKSEKDALLKRDGNKVIFEPFYIWGRLQGLNKFGVKIITPTFSQYPRFLTNLDKESFFTNGYAISFKSGDDTLPVGKIENLDVIQKILNSDLMHYYVTATSVKIEGGFPCYQKNFIERFNFPNLTLEEIEELRKLDDKNEINKFLIRRYQINISVPNLLS